MFFVYLAPLTVTIVKDNPNYLACTYHTKHQLLCHEGKVHGFSALQYQFSENLPLHVWETRLIIKPLIVEQLLHHVRTEEINYDYVLLQPKHELPLYYVVAVLTMFWSFLQFYGTEYDCVGNALTEAHK